MLDVGWVNLCK